MSLKKGVENPYSNEDISLNSEDEIKKELDEIFDNQKRKLFYNVFTSV